MNLRSELLGLLVAELQLPLYLLLKLENSGSLCTVLALGYVPMRYCEKTSKCLTVQMKEGEIV